MQGMVFVEYRREIDGLRAVAVLPVILFHAGFSFFSGGFVGVDVFFVVSGYLITSILIAELEQGNFSIARFYERRARRILPALFVVMLACLPFAYMWMLPSQLEDFSESLVTTVLSLSNIYFLSQVNYFAPDAELQPLLHTWSLAIEEQYYFLFPLMLLALRRFSLKTKAVCIFWLVVISFLFSEWAWRENSARSFFFTLSRFWEIGVGSICAFFSVGRAQRSSNVLSMAGLAMIVVSIFAYSDRIPSPSAYTLVPVVGTALIILFAAKETWVAQLLSLRGFVGIGLISYSAYLWHQPLFAFARLRSLTEPSYVLMGGLAVAALLLAWATWRYVEQPFRKRANPALVTQRSVFAASGAVGAVFIALGLAGYVGQGFNWRFSAEMLRYVEADNAKPPSPCDYGPEDPVPKHPVNDCLFSNDEGNVNVLLAGDSHMLALSEVLGEALSSKKIGYYHASPTGCLPLRNMRPFGQISNRKCTEHNDVIYNYAARSGITTVVLASRFPWYLAGSQFDNGEGGVESGEAGWVDVAERIDSDANDDERQARVIAAYEQRIRELAEQFNVVLVYPVPEAGWNVPNHAFRIAYFSEENPTITTSYTVYRERALEVNALFDRLVSGLPNVYGARVHEVLCSEATDRCVNADADAVYYNDDDHLNNEGARLVTPTIIEAIEAALQGKQTTQPN
jgi:peptidoglycan/LPS O-acetylase OafA/YrhL